MTKAKARKTYVICSACGKQDKPDTSVIPHNVGTSTVMRCRDCAADSPHASKCRACCPTGHGTRIEDVVLRIRKEGNSITSREHVSGLGALEIYPFRVKNNGSQ